jgi:hypothetical protein
MASKETVAKAFVLLSANWPTYAFTATTMPTYQRMLEDLPDAVLEAAVLDCIATSRFFPTVAEIREAAANIVTDAVHATNEYDAWAEVKKAVSRTQWTWSDPMIGAAMQRVGGLHAFGMSEMSDEPSWRSRFIECYRMLRARERRQMTMLPQVRELTERLALERGEDVKQLEDGR